MSTIVTALLARLQPNAVGFNGEGVVANPSRWIGSESGYAPRDTWSTGAAGAGDPSGSWNPAETDFTTLDGDTWFYQVGVPVRSPATLRAMYEQSVGHNSVALVGIGIPPNGSMVGTLQSAALATLGAYISGCYSAPVVSEVNASATILTLMPSSPTSIDRIVFDEDQTRGQLIRGYTVTLLLSNGSFVLADAGASIGNRHITVLESALTVAQATLNITAAVAPTRISFFALYSGCNALARELDDGAMRAV